MEILDLHSAKHADVPRLVDSFLYKNINNLPVKVITGNSSKMRTLVINTAKEMGYEVFDNIFTEITIY